MKSSYSPVINGYAYGEFPRNDVNRNIFQGIENLRKIQSCNEIDEGAHN
jgi:hypothetical protein